MNFKGTVYIVQAALAALAASGHGRVIITSSITGPITGYPGWSHWRKPARPHSWGSRHRGYGVGTEAHHRQRGAARQHRHRGLRRNGPGNTSDQMASAVLAGRLALVADIGNAALFFATDEAAYITGQSLVVDGGQILPESHPAIAELL